MPDADAQAIQGRIEGRVQGVAFRASMQHQARRCGVGGWVRNLPDGSVEFFAQGERQAIQQLLDWARNGPPGASVDALSCHELDATDDVRDFQVRY